MNSKPCVALTLQIYKYVGRVAQIRPFEGDLIVLPNKHNSGIFSFHGFRPVLTLGKQSRALAVHLNHAAEPVLLANDGNLDAIPEFKLDTTDLNSLSMLHKQF